MSDNAPAVDNRETRFEAARDRIKEIVDQAPEFTEEQLSRLSVLLVPPTPQ